MFTVRYELGLLYIYLRLFLAFKGTNKRFSTERGEGRDTSEIPKTEETRCSTSSTGHPASRASQQRYIVPVLGRGARERSSSHNMSGRSWGHAGRIHIAATSSPSQMMTVDCDDLACLRLLSG